MRHRLTVVSTWHYIRLVYRSVLFLLLMTDYITYRAKFGEMLFSRLERRPIIPAAVCAVFIVEMVFRFFPSRYESPGCQKQFERNYRKSGRTEVIIEDNNATILIITPVLAPVAASLGIDPIHFGLVFIFTMMIGVVTPPVGIILFVLQGMSGISFGKLCRAIAPFIIMLIACALLFALVPALSTWLPNLLFG